MEILDESSKYKQVGDWYLYLRLLSDGKIAYNRKSLNRFRIHKSSVTKGHKNGKLHYDEVKGIQEYVATRYSLPEETERRMRGELLRLEKSVL